MKTCTGASFISVSDIVISYRVYMRGLDFITLWHDRTLHPGRRVFKYVAPSWIRCWKLRMRYPFQAPGRVISRRDERSYRVYMTSAEWVFVLEWKSRSGAVTCVNSYRYDSLWYEILCWYYINEYRASRGNWSELVREWKSRRYQSFLKLLSCHSCLV